MGLEELNFQWGQGISAEIPEGMFPITESKGIELEKQGDGENKGNFFWVGNKLGNI